MKTNDDKRNAFVNENERKTFAGNNGIKTKHIRSWAEHIRSLASKVAKHTRSRNEDKRNELVNEDERNTYSLVAMKTRETHWFLSEIHSLSSTKN